MGDAMTPLNMGMSVPKKYKKNPRTKSFENVSSHRARHHRSREVDEEIREFEHRNLSYEPDYHAREAGKYQLLERREPQRRDNFDLD
jgi:hypothetical protein